MSMQAGTIVRIPNRGRATVVYHGLDGYGVIWGVHAVDKKDLPKPDAMLRDQYPSADVECVGEVRMRLADSAMIFTNNSETEK